MKPYSHRLPALLLALALAACTSSKPTSPAHSAAQTAPPINRATAPRLPMPRLPGQATVQDILDDYGEYAALKLKPYFAKAAVPYPPKSMLLLALKDEKKLELWARGDGEYRLIRNFPIKAASGKAGPKLRQGDKQVPEGVYRILSLNPNSNYHLSMKLDYPNSFDLDHANQEGRYDPGSDIFIHGKAVSIGCIALGDEAIEELFVLTAQVGKENVKVVIAPHDPRTHPLDPYADGLPTWADALYATITQEINALTPPVNLSNNSRLPARR